MPLSSHPNLLVGLENRDDAGVFRLSEDQALVQTVDFFTPIVDDPYAYGAIAAANALSDVYAMGGKPLTVLNIACFDPEAAPAEVWAQVLLGAYDKTTEAGALVLGGHSVIDDEPKFGMSVTGMVNPNHMFANTNAKVGDRVYLTKSLGTGIVSTAIKFEGCSPEQAQIAINSMMMLNREACEIGLKHGVRCATDITGFGLVGHLYNVARASDVSIEIDTSALPVFPGIEEMVANGFLTGGSAKNRAFVSEACVIEPSVPNWLIQVCFDPQSSGGLALFTNGEIEGYPCIGRVVDGPLGLRIL